MVFASSHGEDARCRLIFAVCVSTDLVLVPQAVEEARVALLVLALVVLQAEDGQRGRHRVAQVVDQELFWPALINAEAVRPEAH